jgi:AcrR family transcriptional regulator
MARSADIKQKTIRVAREMFFQNGYTDVSIEDIIKKVDISKKTLYRYFVCKDDILNEVIHDFTENLTRDINEMLDRTNMEFPEKLKIIFTNTAVSLSGISTRFYENIRKSSPRAWEKVTAYKREIAQKCFSNLMDEGIQKGHISKDINKDIALLTFLTAVENLFDPIFLDQLPQEMLKGIPRSPREIFDAVIKVIYEGILTEDTKKKYLANNVN